MAPSAVISGPDLPAIPGSPMIRPRQAVDFVELKSEQGGRVRGLLAQADIVSQGYRPKSIAASLLAEDAARSIPHISVSLSPMAMPAVGGAPRLRLAGADVDRFQSRRRQAAAWRPKGIAGKCSITPPAI